MRKLESLGQYHDKLVATFMSAPDHFLQTRKVPVDQRIYFLEAFESLRAEFHFVEKKIKEPRLSRILREMIELAFEAYETGQTKLGSHVLQEFEGLIWKSAFRRIKHAVEAERRAFGTVELYKNVRITPYPYEGTAKDLGWDQRRLFVLAEAQSQELLLQKYKYKFLCWACSDQGNIVRMTIEPRSDSHEPLHPLQKSWRGTLSRLKELAKSGQIRACVVTEPPLLPDNPIGSSLSYRLEERGAPRILAISPFKPNGRGTYDFSPTRFHLNDPYIFSEEPEAA